MATNIETKESALVIALGKLHPDYTIAIEQPVTSIYPYLHVHNAKQIVTTEIRLPIHHWNVKILDRLVKKAIKNIEAPKTLSAKGPNED